MVLPPSSPGADQVARMLVASIISSVGASGASGAVSSGVAGSSVSVRV